MHPLSLFHFCPKCGSPHFVDNDEKSKRCLSCGFIYYFNPAAATVALIEREAPQTADDELADCKSSNRPIEWCVVRRAKQPALGTLDLPGGFSDLYETSEEGVCREVLEETGLHVIDTQFLFSLPNIYEYSGFQVHTIDMFYRCQVEDTEVACAHDDAGEVLWMRPEDIHPGDFGLVSIRRGVERLLEAYKRRGF